MRRIRGKTEGITDRIVNNGARICRFLHYVLCVYCILPPPNNHQPPRLYQKTVIYNDHQKAVGKYAAIVCMYQLFAFCNTTCKLDCNCTNYLCGFHPGLLILLPPGWCIYDTGKLMEIRIQTQCSVSDLAISCLHLQVCLELKKKKKKILALKEGFERENWWQDEFKILLNEPCIIIVSS